MNPEILIHANYAIFSTNEINVRLDKYPTRVGEEFNQLTQIAVERQSGRSTVVYAEEVVCRVLAIWSYGQFFDELGDGLSARLTVNPEFVLQLSKFIARLTDKKALLVVSKKEASDGSAQTIALYGLEAPDSHF